MTTDLFSQPQMVLNEGVVILLMRVFLGILFLFQGYDKLFKIKIAGVADTFRFELNTVRLPGAVFMLTAVYTSIVEFLGGIALILGIFKYYALYLLGLDLLLVAIAMGLMKPLWDMEFVFPRLVLLILLLVFPPSWDIFSLDNYFFSTIDTR